MNDDHDAKDALPPIASRAQFAAAVRWAFERARQQRSRRLVCVDPDFADWPLDDAALLEGLTAWLKLPQRKLMLLASSFDEMLRRHPRFVAWRADWVHAVEAFAPPEGERVELPTALVDDQALSLELVDRVRWHGRVALDARSARQLRESFDAQLQRSEPAFPVNRLGL